MLDSHSKLFPSDFPAIFRAAPSTLQVNLGYTCNLSCSHCHVNAGPHRSETMPAELIDLLLNYIDQASIQTLDLTGGAPEMNAHFRRLCTQARERGVRVIDRCNLTILRAPGYRDMAQFLADNRIEIVASLPCYSEENVRQQRGRGVFEDSIWALKRLNQLGYGHHPELTLNLVYNPNGAFLPGNQSALEAAYKVRLSEDFGVVFNQLFTITNMPIQRFGATLLAKGQFSEYMTLLKNAYSERNLDTLMCKEVISIDWQGYVFDCDFNQMLDLGIAPVGNTIASDRARVHLRDLLSHNVEGLPIQTGDHCYGCTAGQGSSCEGALNAG